MSIISQKGRSSMTPALVVGIAVAGIVLIAWFLLTQHAKQTQVPAMPTPPPVGNVQKTSTLSGTIQATDGNEIKLSVMGIPADNGMKYEQSIRTVHVSNSTKILILKMRSSEDILNEQQADIDAYRSGKITILPPPPAPYTTRSAALSDLHVGDSVIVSAASSTDISESADIDAVSISATAR